MFVSKSFGDNKPKLYLVATPIGNLDDITKRQMDTLKMVDIILCEDTRNSRVLLDYLGISKPLVSYHEYNKLERRDQVIRYIKEGKNLALISDAGNPVISDPGFEITKDLLQEGVSVVPVPGISAYTTCLIASGISPKPHTFYGFLDHKKAKRIEELKGLKSLNQTIIFYESIHRVKETLNDLYEVLGDRKVTIGRELTKLHEEFIYGTLSEVKDYDITLKGEIVIVVEKPDSEDEVELDIVKEVDFLIDSGEKPKEAIKTVAKLVNKKTSEVYEFYHKTKKAN